MRMICLTTALILATVVGEVLAAYTVENSCPPNLVQSVGTNSFSVMNGTCFLFWTKSFSTYESAQRMCKINGGSLAMPKTKTINDFLIEEMQRFKPIEAMWIGMYDKEKEGTWVWEDGSSVKPWGNTDFFNGGLFGGGEDCMALNPNDKKWHDYRCSADGLLEKVFFSRDAKLPFICQYSVGNKAPTVDGGQDDQDGKGKPVYKDQSTGDKLDQQRVQGAGDKLDLQSVQGAGDKLDQQRVQGAGDKLDLQSVQRAGDKLDQQRVQGAGDKLDQSVQGDEDTDNSDLDQGNQSGSSDPQEDIIVKEDKCEPFNCPTLNCGMDGYKIINGCQLCECDF